jgi:hypothetical protein
MTAPFRSIDGAVPRRLGLLPPTCCLIGRNADVKQVIQALLDQ